MIGRQVHQFKITEKLGAGGMGEVYIAEDTRLRRRVALKFLPPHYSADPDFKARFEHEATAAAALNHPNIVTVYELGDHEGRLFIALELVEGRSLEQMIEAGDVKISTAVRIAQQAAEGLAAAHDAGIVHRDIKPANILVDKSGRLKILDFGLAKSRRATTETKIGTTVGTIQYESPEQGRGDTVDPRSDLFSLGVVLYELIAGRRPFAGEFTDAIRYAIANETPDPLARYKADVPDDLQRIVSKLLEKDPELRYQSAGGLVSDLKLLQRSSGPTPSSVHSSYHSAAAPPRRKIARIVIPVFAAIMATLLLVFNPWRVKFEPSQEASAGEDRLAVMYFENMADPDDAQRQGSIVANLLISSLSGSNYLQVVSSQRLFDILKQLGQEGSRVITPDIASQVAKKATAKWMLTGSILQSRPSWVVSAQLVDVATGNVLASPTVRGRPGEEIFDVVDRLTAGIKGNLALPAAALAELDRPVMQLTSGSADAYALYIEGRDLENQYRKVEAEKSYLAALRLDSTFAMAHYGLALIRASLWDDFAGAKEELKKAMQYSDRASDLDRLYITGLDFWFENRMADAIKTYERITKEHPDEKEAYTFLATIYRIAPEVQNLNRAVALYDTLLTLDPLYSEAYNMLAYIYDEQGNFEKSILAANTYISLQPDRPNPYDSRAELYARNGQLEASLASYLKALEIDSNFTSAYDGAFAMYMFLGRHDDAARLSRYFLTQENPDARLHGLKLQVNLAMYRGQFKEALRLLDSATTADRTAGRDAQNLQANMPRRGDILALLYRYDDLHKNVKDMATIARRIDSSGRMLTMVTVGAALWETDTKNRARVDSLLALLGERDIQWMGATYQFLMGCAALQAGQGDSAAACFHRQAGASLTFNEMFWLGRAYLTAGNLRDAIQMFEQALGNYGSSRWARPEMSILLPYYLAQAYEKSGRRDKAQEMYRAIGDQWKNADTDIPVYKDAKSRLTTLGA